VRRDEEGISAGRAAGERRIMVPGWHMESSTGGAARASVRVVQRGNLSLSL
jgi:hypothetical protein